MNVFLTGASGFVGSHLLDLLRAENHRVSILLRPTSDTRFIAGHLAEVRVTYGSVNDDPRRLTAAMGDAEVVIHCAGVTKALGPADFYRTNHAGTRNVVAAANACPESLQHLIHISSQAVSGPGTVDHPVEETDAPRPVTAYGHSKLLGETHVRQHCRIPWTVLRPAAVYGPRDTDFLAVFQAVKRRLMPLTAGHRRAVNLVYGPDVAAAALLCAMQAQAMGNIYHVAAEPACSDLELMQEIAAQLGLRPLRLRIPRWGLYLSALTQEMWSRLTGRAHILSRQKLPELLASGWVCSTARIREDLGFTAPTALPEGVARALAWYHRKGWL